MTTSGDKVTIKIPRHLYNRLKVIIDDSGFNSVTDFIVYVLRDIVAGESHGTSGNRLTHDEIELIRERLKNLGYL